MNNVSAHILRTDPAWFYFLRENKVEGEVNFWRKDIKSVTNMNRGNRIYFLRKKTKMYPEIGIIGMALFERYTVMTIDKAWESFGKNNGCDNLDDFRLKFSSQTLSDIGCLILKDITFFEKLIKLEDVNISFSRKIQSRKSISIDEEKNILGLVNKYETNNCLASHDTTKKGKDIRYLSKHRVNQQYFRETLIQLYGKCVICGMENKLLLRASHSKSWSESNEDEKINSSNGLLLCPNHDSLYDKHLISFDENKKILISPKLTKSDIDLLNIPKDLHINVSNETMKYIGYHRQKFLEDENL